MKKLILVLGVALAVGCELKNVDAIFDTDYQYEITGVSASVRISYKDENGDFVNLVAALPFTVDLEEMPSMFLQALNNEDNVMTATVYEITYTGENIIERRTACIFIDIQ